ncbi:MAG: N-6 DNA methylase [Phycisphaerae bacterium]|nr:N-6 DNA methylase [Phycisphaerae bacterium]
MRDYVFGAQSVPLAAFAETPHDSRSACIAVVEAASAPEQLVAATRPLGAPVVFACHGGTLQWWKQTTGVPQLLRSLPAAHIQEFFLRHKDDFSPSNIFEGKTRRRLPGQSQLGFVDAGLMPFVERTDGDRLSRCIELAFREIESVLGRKLASVQDMHNAIKATFWILAAKALHDKAVDNFKTVALADIDDLFARVGRHYGVPDDVPPPGRLWHEATVKAAARIAALDDLRNLSTEALAHVYENALVTPAVRKAYGIHSTPGALVDYIVWQLRPWLNELPKERRHVFEPACGHAAFLVGALRVLRQSSGIDDGRLRHDYLKHHLHGLELDAFALEVARLRLTLADAPFGNTWDLRGGDMFVGNNLQNGARRCGLLLANPPYEKFTKRQLAAYSRQGITVAANTKASEMLRRAIPFLSDGACFGVVVPRGFLHSREAEDVRREILTHCELYEVDILEDKLFQKADHEVAVLLGRRRDGHRAAGSVWVRRVRNAGMDAFRDQFAFSSEQQVDVARFQNTRSADLRIPECSSVWDYLSAYPRLSSVAVAGQGFSFHGVNLPAGAETLSTRRRAGYRECFVTSRGDPPIFQTPERTWMNPSPAVIQSPRLGLRGRAGQVLVNHARASRGVWSMKGWLDEEGLAIKGNFLVVRPRPGIQVPGLVIWALLNSPLANAFVYCLATKHHIIGGDLLNLPIPQLHPTWVAAVSSAAIAYRTAAKGSGGILTAEPNPSEVKAKLLQMDAAVLNAYDLAPQMERQVLNLFSNSERRGVGCKFTGYYQEGFSSCLPLRFIISEEFSSAAADVTAERFRPGESRHVLDALVAATSSEEEE